jgi:hypothetical protein
MRRVNTALIATAVLLALSTSARAQEYDRLTQTGGSLGVTVDETVVFSLGRDQAGRPVWFARRSRRDRNWCGGSNSAGRCAATDLETYDSADSVRCSALNVIVAGFANFRSSTPALKTSDTTLITLSGHTPGTDQPQFTISGYIGSLATWWRESDDKLQSCWTPLLG